MLNLPFVDVANPYYTARKMKLYYEFMIKENLPKVKKWRDFKKQKNSANLKEHLEWKKRNKIDKVVHHTILALEIEFRRGDIDSANARLSRQQIEAKYIADPLM